MTSIPTMYAGVQFRSRLEARWAAYYDQLGIKWEYEPIDLPGWIPDFRIPCGRDGSLVVGSKHYPYATVLLEIKPTPADAEAAASKEVAPMHRLCHARGMYQQAGPK